MEYNKNASCIVVDNFYSNPDEVRAWALEQNYKAPGDHGAVGYRSEEGRKIWPGTKETFEKLLHGKIEEGGDIGGWDYSVNGCFQWCPAGTPMVFHCDPQNYAAMVYLCPDAPTEGGTGLYKHKETGLTQPANEIDFQRMFKKLTDDDSKNFVDSTLYEMTDKVANVYNRCVIMNVHNLHSGGPYFGDTIYNSRLFQNFFFNVLEGPRPSILTRGIYE